MMGSEETRTELNTIQGKRLPDRIEGVELSDKVCTLQNQTLGLAPYFAVTSWGCVEKLLFSSLSFLLCHMRIITPIIRLMNG